MSRISELTSEDRQRVNALIDEITDRLNDDVGTTAVTRALSLRLFELDDDGEHWAKRTIRALVVDGARNMVGNRLSEDRSFIRLSRTGKVISVSSRVGVKARSEAGEAQSSWQQPLWWELSWERFEQYIDTMRRQRDQLSIHIAAYLEILELRTQYPESRTPFEACDMAGIDPRRFGLEDESSVA